MKNGKYLKLGFLVLVVMIFFAGVLWAFHGEGKGEKKIVHLQLDDRPANDYVPAKIAEVGGFEIKNMPRDLLERISPGEENFELDLTDEMGDYLLNKSEDADAFVISADMLFFGGLLSSRNLDLYDMIEEGMNSRESVFYRGASIIKKLKEKYPGTPVYMYSSIQRLAPNMNKVIGEDEYRTLRYWAVNYDRVNNKGMDEYETQLSNFEAELEDDILDSYLNTRELNHKKNKELIELLSEGYFDYLIISQDDAHEYGLHRVEREELKEKIRAYGLNEKTEIFAGTDEVDGILISRFINDYFDREPSIYPVYPDLELRSSDSFSDYKPGEWIPPLEDITLEENLKARVRALGGRIAENRKGADLTLFINTLCCGCGDEKTYSGILRSEIEKFAGEIASAARRGENIAVADVARLNGSCLRFVDSLLEKIKPLELFSYSGWNTAGNSLGQALSQANSRLFFLDASRGEESYLVRDDNNDDKNDNGNVKSFSLKDERIKIGIKAQVELLFHRFAKDYYYLGNLREDVREYVEYLDGDDNNLGEDKILVMDYFRIKLRPELEAFYRDYFAGGRIGVNRSGCDCCSGFGDDYCYYVVKDFLGLEVDFPWGRLFEAYISPKISLVLE